MTITAPSAPSEADMLSHYLSSLPYLERRKEYWGSPNNYPRFLYKYLGPDITDEWLSDLLIGSRLYLKSPTEFNDPFDMTGKITDEPDPRKKKARFMQLYRNWLPHLGRKERRAETQKQMRNPNTFENLKKTLLETIGKYGVYCFTEKPSSILMWSHYGHHHRGLVLQFDFARDAMSFGYILPVDYQEEFPTISYFDNDPKKNVDYLLRKYKDWGYEKEWRIIKPEHAGTYHPFHSAALRGVILGCRIDAKDEARIRALLEERKKSGMGIVKVYRASQHGTDYKIVISRAQRESIDKGNC